jgi:hypothetical protein
MKKKERKKRHAAGPGNHLETIWNAWYVPDHVDVTVEIEVMAHQIPKHFV